MNASPTVSFIHDLRWTDLPDPVQNQTRRCLLDTIGAGISGSATPLARIIRDFAASTHGGRGAFLWCDGREVSPPGAALANGMTIDAIDIHDGHPLVKGHAGAAVVPAALALLPWKPAQPLCGTDLLMNLVVGYEIALRAGMALHASVSDYHTSGAWNALGCAAGAARRLGLTAAQTGHALGIAEYHGPRSQMMRCIDYPTMVKDGSGWGAMAGVGAALLASDGFTGAPALTVEAGDQAPIWSNLGQKWHIEAQYFKPHAVCRWAQPAIQGALVLKQRHDIRHEAVCAVRVHTFHEATRLNHRQPHSTEEAQYSLTFPLALALIHGKIEVSDLIADHLNDPMVVGLSQSIALIEDKSYSEAFPRRRFARVEIETRDGKCYDSGKIEAPWDAANPPTDMDLRLKFRDLALKILPERSAADLEDAIWNCDQLPDAGVIFDQLVPKAGRPEGISS